MSITVVAEQSGRFRGALVSPKTGHAVVVQDDFELIQDSDYAEDVMDSLVEAWEKGDYFLVRSFDEKGEEVESVGSMAGYGGWKKAAKAAIKDYGF